MQRSVLEVGSAEARLDEAGLEEFWEEAGFMGFFLRGITLMRARHGASSRDCKGSGGRLALVSKVPVARQRARGCHPGVRPTGMAELEPAVLEIATQIEHTIAEHGWDQPPTLWRVEAAAPLAVCHDRVLDGHPAAALVGVRLRGAVGCAVAVEGWSYSEVKMEWLQAGRDLLPPSAYADRVEVRNIHVVMRDGTEVAAHRVRGREVDVFAPSDGVRVGGRVGEAARRVLGVPSNASVDAGVAQMRERALLAMIGGRLDHLIGQGVALTDAIASVRAGREALLTAATWMGLETSDWDAAVGVARLDPWSHPLTRVFAHWADGAMWGQRLEDIFAIAEATREQLESMCGAEAPLLEQLYRELGIS